MGKPYDFMWMGPRWWYVHELDHTPIFAALFGAMYNRAAIEEMKANGTWVEPTEPTVRIERYEP